MSLWIPFIVWLSLSLKNKCNALLSARGIFIVKFFQNESGVFAKLKSMSKQSLEYEKFILILFSFLIMSRLISNFPFEYLLYESRAKALLNRINRLKNRVNLNFNSALDSWLNLKFPLISYTLLKIELADE